MQLVVLAAGQGKRLGALSQGRSKAMMPVLGHPMIARVLERLVQPEIEEIILVAHPADQALQAFFSGGSWHGYPVQLVFQPERKGSGNALSCATGLIRGPFLLSACDSLSPAAHTRELLAAWESQPRPTAVLSLLPGRVEQLSQSGVVRLEGEWVTYIVEKPAPAAAPSNILSLPLYIFPFEILDFLPETPVSPRGEYELQYAIQRLIDAHGRVRGVLAGERQALTGPQDLLRINLDYLRVLGMDSCRVESPLPEGARVVPPVYIEAGVTAGAGCAIGPEVYLEGGSAVDAGATVRRAVVLRGGQVRAGERVEGQVVGQALSSAAASI